MNKKINNNYYLLIISIIISMVIGYNSLNPAKLNYDDNSKVKVSNQLKHLEEIAKEPHSIFDDEAHTKVREYIVSELNKLEVDSKIYEYEDVYIERTDTKEDIKNIYAQVDGKSDSYIMLVTHYDSSHAKEERYAEEDGSHGAADAGYAVSTILEVLRVIKEENIELENGIKVLITDGEEYGLVGAKEAVKEEEVFEGVNYLVNIEARGTKGPAVMFETSPNNKEVADLYSNASTPFSYSIAPEIYRFIPNPTDFTVFLENEITGINISVLDGLENYHTPNDSLENISEKSMQHYGDQILPIVEEFVTNPKYSDPNVFESDSDSIFFTFGKNLIKYSTTVNYILLALIIVGTVLLIRTYKINKVSSVLRYAGINTGFTIGAMAVAYLFTRIVAMINGRPYKLTYLPLMKYEKLLLVSFIILVLMAYLILVKKVTKSFKEKNAYIIGSLLPLIVLSILFTLFLPGGSYLTVFPALLIVLFVNLVECVKHNKKLTLIMIIPICLITILYVPTVYLFNAALTFGALCANVLFIMIAFMSIIPCALKISNE